MSEMTKLSNNSANLRAKLLATACCAALLAATPVLASDADKPLAWIELGGAFTQLENGQENYLPPFTLVTPRLPFITESPAATEKSAPTSWDGNAKITFEPSGTDWVLSAAIVYGRSTRSGNLRQQTANRTNSGYGFEYKAFQSTTSKNSENHMILDFQAGRDVGLGVFGNDGRSRLSFGARYAQLNSQSDVSILYQPTNNIIHYHKFSGSLAAQRKFTGIGPSLSWDAAAMLFGNAAGGGISLDWGANGAVLFGRQQVRGRHQTSNLAVPYNGGTANYFVYQTPHPVNRSKQAIVPNLGGFAGISWRYPNAKISIGYRADMFFGAMDGGIDARKTFDRGFYGPFAAISIGLGG